MYIHKIIMIENKDIDVKNTYILYHMKLIHSILERQYMSIDKRGLMMKSHMNKIITKFSIIT